MTGVLDRLASVMVHGGISSLKCPRARVLLVLLLYGGRDGHAYPSTRTIAELSRTEPRNVRRALAELCAAGVIERVSSGRGGRPTGGGRVSTSHYRVAPQATDGLFVELMGGETRVGDTRVADETRVGQTLVNDESRVAETRVEAETRVQQTRVAPETRVAQSRNPGLSGPKPGSVEPPKPKGTQRNPPGGGAPHSAQGGAAPLDPPSAPLLEAEPSVVELADAISAAGVRARQPRFRVLALARRCHAEQGLTADVVPRLLALAERHGREPVALLATWLDRATWRDVLADADLAIKERRIAAGSRPAVEPRSLREVAG